MIIRPGQVALLSNALDRDFRARVRQHIEDCFPDLWARLPGDARDRFIDDAFERARRHRLRSEWELVRYLDLVACFGMDFESLPAMSNVNRILSDADLNARTRLNAVYAEVHDMGPSPQESN